ncbi:hypothetical protein [Deinococcus roseus]|uniref:Uncharacterized protein n=1 Tax=Deinococcus roseus TaxID=392414 RepID=A0ABQ2DIC5_9DEIO|nr:hypothetical protein [Deinococcus roseus]GGJ56636.1 hypothetical protein GCM10008938_48500 [Deinococcus roseus]
MFPGLQQLLARIPEFEHTLKCSFQETMQAIKAVYGAAARTSRILEQEYGVIPVDTTPAGTRYGARNLTQLPLIYDTYETPATTRQTLQFESDNQNRLISRGYYSNMGDNPIRVILLDQQGMPGKPHVLLPGTTINVSCYLKGMMLEPVTPEDEIKYQVLVQ